MNIFAYTAPGASYPEYVSVNTVQDDADKLTVTVRSAPKREEGAYICGIEGRDEGKPGRCIAGDDNCNNYCNMAPEKGKMQDHPKPCVHIREGSQAVITLTRSQAKELVEQLSTWL